MQGRERIFSFPLSIVFLEIKKKDYETTGKNKDKIIFQTLILRMWYIVKWIKKRNLSDSKIIKYACTMHMFWLVKLEKAFLQDYGIL